jgi:choice-of-anchor B domain-containing protein
LIFDRCVKKNFFFFSDDFIFIKKMVLKTIVLLFCFVALASAQVSPQVNEFVGVTTLQQPAEELRSYGALGYPHLDWGATPADVKACPQLESIEMFNISCEVPSFLSVGFAWANSSDAATRADGLAVLDSVFAFLNSGVAVAPINDVWGYDDVKFGNAYALIGAGNGLSVVDVTVPQVPRITGFFPGAYSIWRDVKTRGHYAYYVQDNYERFSRYTAVNASYNQMLKPTDGLSIVDLSYPGSPRLVKHDLSEFTYAHNLFIEVDGDRPYAYVCGGDITPNGGIGVLDLSDPEAPKLIHKWDTIYIHDLMVQRREDDGRYILYGAAIYAKSGEPALWLIDVSDPANPEVISSHASRSGWLHNVWPSADSHYLYVSHELNGEPVGVWDARDIDNIKELEPLYLTEDNALVAAHNVFVRDNTLWISYYSMGAVAYDISKSPKKPQLLARFDTYPQGMRHSSGGLSGCWGMYPFAAKRSNSGPDDYYVYASDITNGLYVLRLAPAEAAVPGPRGESGAQNLTWFVVLTFIIEFVLALGVIFLLYRVLSNKVSYESV